ncbi:MAG: hypothetical protein OEV94_09230 [Deltaproteobacteria bacterium]|nr:hypothetical protein [Deltaproteobacteria bacterium]
MTLQNPYLEADEVQKSLERCLTSAKFLDLFAVNLIHENPDVSTYLGHLSPHKAKSILHHGLVWGLRLAHDSPSAKHVFLRVRDGVHKQLGIPNHLFDAWLVAAIAAARVSDPLFTPDLELLWQKVLGRVVAFMKGEEMDQWEEEPNRLAGSMAH